MLSVLVLVLILAVISSAIAVTARRSIGGSDKELLELRERMNRLEQSMETMAGDMDRVAESQRFMTALLEDRGRNQGTLRPAPPPPEGPAVG